MKRILCLALIVLSVVGCCSAYAQSEKKYESVWEGNLDVGSKKIKVILKIILNNNGTRSAFLDSPDQGAFDIKASSVAITEDSLKFEVKQLGAVYSGKINHDSLTAVGKFKQGPGILNLELKKTDKVAGLNRPQMPKKPYPYNEIDLTFPNSGAKITLAGTLTLPKGNGKFPAVVLVTGSGPQDRDESLFGHKPFLVIADYLTRNGIAVLRCDDRGVGKSTGNFAAALTTDFVTDVLSAIEYLKTRKEIDPNRIGIVGHSEGGMIAPLAASTSDDVKFIVMLAGPGMIGKDLIPLQTKLMGIAGGASEKEASEQMTKSKEMFEIIANTPDSLEAYNKLFSKYQEDIAKMTPEEKAKPEYSKEAFDSQVKQLLSPWFRFFIKYDPRPALENVRVPVLAMNGEKDLQVPMKENLSIVESSLKTGGNTNYKIVSLPGLNHLFQTAETGGIQEYGKIEETISPNALKIIGDWILEITSNK